MATTDYNVEFDKKYIREFNKYLPEAIQVPTTDEFLDSGIIQRDRLMEIACAAVSKGKYEVISEDGRDFTDGSDMKTVTINQRLSQKNANVIITSIKNKTGPLRVVALDPVSGEFHYIVIFDFESCRNYNRVEFTMSKRSKYLNGKCGIKFDTFEEMANFTLSSPIKKIA